MTRSPVSRLQISTAFVGFLLIGMASGAWGVLLPNLSAFYHVGRSVVGLLFFASATWLLIWFIPSVIACAAAFFVVGALLGPIYPSTVARLSDMVKRGLIESAMGFLLSMSILGGALFPWVAGTLAQYRGTGALAPYALSLTVVMLVLWCAMRRGLQGCSQDSEKA